MIESFEKNPDINGTPINAVDDKPIIDKVEGILIIFIPIIRMSW